jgi:hypothetical protein
VWAQSDLSEEWRTTFSPGTSAIAEATTYPPMADLTSKFREVYSDLCDAATSPDEATLSAPNPFEAARPHSPLGANSSPTS